MEGLGYVCALPGYYSWQGLSIELLAIYECANSYLNAVHDFTSIIWSRGKDKKGMSVELHAIK